MASRYEITAEQKSEIETARKKNKNKRVEARLKVLIMRAEGKTAKEISEASGYHYSSVTRIVTQYIHGGIEAICGSHYGGNRRNMTYEEEAEILAPFQEKANKGQLITVSDIAAAYQKEIKHIVGANQIYYVLRRHGWRKVMPRSRHPKKASDEAIEASKKLTPESKK